MRAQGTVKANSLPKEIISARKLTDSLQTAGAVSGCRQGVNSNLIYYLGSLTSQGLDLHVRTALGDHTHAPASRYPARLRALTGTNGSIALTSALPPLVLRYFPSCSSGPNYSLYPSAWELTRPCLIGGRFGTRRRESLGRGNLTYATTFHA